MAWQPNHESLQALIGYINDSHNGRNTIARKEAETMLAQAKTSPDFVNYLAYAFSSSTPPAGIALGDAEYLTVRVAAAIMLKNQVRAAYKQTPAATIALIKSAVLIGLNDPGPIRNHAGNIATEVIRRGGLYAWPELLTELLAMVANTAGTVAPSAQEAAMSAIAKICEDNARLLESEHNGQRPLNALLPALVDAAGSAVGTVRVHALSALNEFIPRRTQAMLAHIDALLQRLFALATDTNNDVRREVCRAFVLLVETRSDKLQPHIAGLVDYIIAQQQDDTDEDLACQAVEFWLSAGEHADFWRQLEPYVEKIVPSLLEGMVYTGEDIALLGSASDDEDEEDRAEDIKPQFAKRSQKRTAGSANPDKFSSMDDADDADELEDGEIDDDDDDDDGMFEGADQRWTVRKGSAAALDVLARDFGDAMFPCVLPFLLTNIKHSDWPRREAAVLALGAVADGCMDAVAPHLPELIPYLITLLDDAEPLVRQITCWTLARYSSWAIGRVSDPVNPFFVPIMDGCLTKMLDGNKKVQEAAASAMATLEEKAGKKIEPFVGPIVAQYVVCFGKYKDRSLSNLYDCVQTLAEVLGPVLALPELSGQLMPALMKRYDAVSNESRELFPLLECFSYVALSLGTVFSPYAPHIFRRCITIIYHNLEQSLAAAGNVHLDAPEKDFLVTTLDLISSIIQAIPSAESAQLIAASQPSFFELVSFCMEDPSDEVRQSAYAVVGDCAKFVYAQMEPCLPALMPILLKQLDLESLLDDEIDSEFNVVNNACWSVGEIAIQHGAKMAPWVDALLVHFVETMTNPRVPRGLGENAAIALGRLGLGNAEQLAPHLTSFAGDFLAAMDEVDPTEEKATAFKGFTLTVARNPQAMEAVLLRFFRAIADYKDIGLRSPIKQELHEVFQSILQTYRQMIPEFETFVAQLGPVHVAALRAQYTW